MNNNNTGEIFTNLRDDRCYHSSIVNGTEIILLGGDHGLLDCEWLRSDIEIVHTTPSSSGNSSARRLPDIPTNVSFHASVINNGYLYVIGGYKCGFDPCKRRIHDRDCIIEPSKSVFRIALDNIQSGWEEIKEMNKFRAGCAATAWGDYIIVFGGEGRTIDEEYNCLEILDTTALDLGWQRQRECMKGSRVSHSVVTIKDSIFIIGGRRYRDRRHKTRNFEKFNPINKTFRLCTAPPTGFAQTNAVAIGTLLVIICGSSYHPDYEDIGPSYICDTTSSKGKWEVVHPPLHTPRRNHTTDLVGNYIYICGGKDRDDECLRSVERLLITDFIGRG